MKKALITGILGQDGFYLAKLLKSKGYKIYGIHETANDKLISNFSKFYKKAVFLIECNITDKDKVTDLIKEIKPDECYHLAAKSFVHTKPDETQEIFEVNINGTLYLLNAILNYAQKCKFYFAATSEMFGSALETPQNESSVFNPRSPYGISKLASYNLVKFYRDHYGIFAASGILYNHESPRRSDKFVSKKIVRGAINIKNKKEKKLILGNIHAKRDWGYAEDYVQAMWMMLQYSNPDDFVISTNQLHSVKEFLEIVFGYFELDWKDFVEFDKKLYRKESTLQLRGDYSKAKKVLGWIPKTDFKKMIEKLIEAELNDISNEKK